MTKTSPDKSAAREQIFKSMQLRRKTFKFRGIDLDLVQPTLTQMVDLRADQNEDVPMVIQVLVKHTFLAGTEERVFDDADIPALKEMGWSEDFSQIPELLQEITGINVQEAVKN